MRRGTILITAVLTAFPLLAGSCDLPFVSGNEHQRTVLVDYHYDQFNAVFAAYLPRVITVRAGDTVNFQTAWNGEPHTVTMGRVVDTAFKIAWPFLLQGPPYGPPPTSDPKFQAFQQDLGKIPSLQGSDPNGIGQAGAQPCFIDSGPVPQDSTKPCPSRAQPAFTGRQQFYNSGFISYYQGSDVTYHMPIAPDATPGTYYFNCLFHGPLMTGQLTIKPKDATIPSQDEVTRQANQFLQRYTSPLTRAYHQAQSGKGSDGKPVAGYFAGTGDPSVEASVAEFIPKTIHARVGQKLTWQVIGDMHSVSFDVPRYSPVFTRAGNGTVAPYKASWQPAGGPGFPNPFASGPPPPPGGVLPPVAVDAGNYDGSHFQSSGVGGPTEQTQEFSYSVTFTRAGNYKFACLVHPQMVGEVDVS